MLRTNGVLADVFFLRATEILTDCLGNGRPRCKIVIAAADNFLLSTPPQRVVSDVTHNCTHPT